MDIFQKMFHKRGGDATKNGSEFRDEFRKPSWFDEEDTDDELFSREQPENEFFQVFTNPIELQKHFDRQMQEICKTMKHFEDAPKALDESPRVKFLNPGFEKRLFEELEKTKRKDTDLDREIYVDQLHSLLHRLSPEIRSILPENTKKPKVTKPKRSDEEIIMGKIHGTILDEEPKTPRSVKRHGGEVVIPKFSPHFGGIFEGSYQGSKIIGQSVMTQTIHKPDGSCETKRIVRDTDGNIKTTITRTVNGKTETITSYDNGNGQQKPNMIKSDAGEIMVSSEPNIYVSKSGYALPKNIW